MQNFDKIRTIFNDIFLESFIKKDKSKKEIFRKYLKALKENNILNTQYLVYKNIESKVETNEVRAINYIKENLELLKKFSTDEIVAENKKLLNLIGNLKVKDSSNESKKTKVNKLHEDLTKLIFTKKSPSTIDTITESMNSVVDYVKENNTIIKEDKKEIIHNGIFSKIAVDKFNEKYVDLTESEKELFNSMISDDETIQSEMLKKLTDGCINLVDERISEADVTRKEKLLNVKVKLLNSKYNKETFISDVTKISELRDDLK